MNAKPIFSNNTLQSIDMSNGYLISFIHKSNMIVLFDSTFTHISTGTGCYYDGGPGLWIANTKFIKFHKCQIISNIALKSLDSCKRPNNKDYYSGNGGGIQYGFSSMIYDISMLFDNCLFE